VGSSVIHLGDHNVPNALMFIDKYTQVSFLPNCWMILELMTFSWVQVSRILNPIVICIQQIDELTKDKGLHSYIQNSFGGAEKLKKEILRDFFMHGMHGLCGGSFFSMCCLTVVVSQPLTAVEPTTSSMLAAALMVA